MLTQTTYDAANLTIERAANTGHWTHTALALIADAAQTMAQPTIPAPPGSRVTFLPDEGEAWDEAIVAFDLLYGWPVTLSPEGSLDVLDPIKGPPYVAWTEGTVGPEGPWSHATAVTYLLRKRAAEK